MRVAHVITGLDIGGAETMLLRLLQQHDRERYEPLVISLTGIGAIGRQIEELGVRVESLGMRRGVPDPLSMFRLVRLLRRHRTDVVQTWLYHADLLGGIAARIAGIRAVAWGIHISYLDLEKTPRLTRWTVRAGAMLSGAVPAKIVCCAVSAESLHLRLGYARDKLLVIQNGFDLGAFRPDPAARASVREELGIGETAPVVGLFARFHPQKDHRCFVDAAARLVASHPDATFILCGEGVTWDNEPLAEWVRAAGLGRNFRLLGPRRDVARITNALDIASLSSSFGEAFPLVIGEAMATGVPGVVTDVGDSALLVGDTGKVVPPRDPDALAAAWAALLAEPPEARARRGAAARSRIAEHFSLPVIAGQYAALYDSLVAARR